MLSPPSAVVAAPSLESPSRNLIITRTRTPITRPRILASVPFSTTDFTFGTKDMFHGGNNQQSFATHPLKPNGQKKNMVARDRSPSDPANLQACRPFGVRQRSAPELGTPARSPTTGNKKTSSWLERDLRTTTFIRQIDGPHAIARRLPTGPAARDRKSVV